MAIQNERWISLEEYHEIERNSEIKYEYSDGRIYDMSGGTSEHSRIALNLGGILNSHLRGKVCCVFNSDMKVLPLGDENPTYYPDITVTCNSDDYKRGSTVIRSPRLIIEVLSPSTASKDRGEKLLAYRACASVEEYVMISTRYQALEVYRRKSTNMWENTQYIAEQVITLTSVELTVPMAEIYAQTDISPLASALYTD
jgi:Uma2 family endonuclease